MSDDHIHKKGRIPITRSLRTEDYKDVSVEDLTFFQMRARLFEIESRWCLERYANIADLLKKAEGLDVVSTSGHLRLEVGPVPLLGRFDANFQNSYWSRFVVVAAGMRRPKGHVHTNVMMPPGVVEETIAKALLQIAEAVRDGEKGTLKKSGRCDEHDLPVWSLRLEMRR